MIQSYCHKPDNNPLTSVRGILTRKIYESKNHRFHVFELANDQRTIQAIYFGFNPPTLAGEEMMLTGRWRHNSEFGTQFHISRYEAAEGYLKRAHGYLDKIRSIIA